MQYIDEIDEIDEIRGITRVNDDAHKEEKLGEKNNNVISFVKCMERE